jgi:hypothetical protein
MTTMFLGAVALKSQTSASGCGILSEADAIEAPALPIGSELAVRVRPAPHGIAELSSLCVAGGSQHHNIGGWINGRGSSDWTELQLGARLRWSIDSGLTLGIAPHLRSQWFRGFPSQHALTWDVQAIAMRGSFSIGVALRHVPIVTPIARPFVHVATAMRFTSAQVAFDLGMNASSELWIGLTAELNASEDILIVAAVRTQPTAVRVASRIILDDRNALVCSVSFQRDIGIAPELTWSWSFAD